MIPSDLPAPDLPAPGHALVAHTGELALALRGRTLAELFEEAGRALAEIMAGGPPPRGGDPVTVSLSAPDREALLVAWLDELVFLSEREGKVFGDVHVERLTGRALAAVVRGAELPAVVTQVKAATFHGLVITEGPGGVEATVVLDV